MVNKTHELYKNIWWFRKKVVPLQRKSLNNEILNYVSDTC